MPTINVFAVPTIAAMLVFWVLGLYVLTRSPRSVSSWLAALGQSLAAIYLFGHALSSSSVTREDYQFWGQRFWFGAAASPVIWYWLTVSFADRDIAPPLLVRALGIVLSLLGVLVLVAGYAGDSLFRWSTPETLVTPTGFPYFGVRPTPLYAVYAVYALASFLAGCLILRRIRSVAAMGSIRRAQAHWLLASGLLFSSGASYLIVGVGLNLPIPAQPGHALLAVGVALVGFGVARYSALLEGQVIRADFLSFVVAALVLTLLYATVTTVLVGISATSLPVILALVLVALASHSAGDVAHGFWDRLFYRSDVRFIRRELRVLQSGAARSPDGIDAIGEAQKAVERASDVQFRALVEDALRKLNNLTALADHPLLGSVRRLVAASLPLATLDLEHPAPALDRARALRQVLHEAIERLRPVSPQPTEFAAPWAHYLVLHSAYEQGLPNKQIMRRYQLSEGSFNRLRRHAVDVIASDLHERETALAHAAAR